MRKITINTLQGMKSSGEKITCLTAYDSTFSRLISDSGIEVILIGDSLGNVIQGHKTTVKVTVEHMVYHTECVTNIEPRSLIITDLPFMSYSTSEHAFKTATIIMQSGAEMIKVEGGGWVTSIISDLVERGIPVCGHLGLTPQSVYLLGGHKVQGRTTAEAQRIMADALQIQDAGASLLVLECIPVDLARTISKKLRIPVIGIGAGVDTDGQVLVLYDILGLSDKQPSFSKCFLSEKNSIADAVQAFVSSIKNKEFPKKDHSYL